MSPVERLRRYIFRRKRDQIIERHELNYLFWECTLRCNLNCLHCGSDCLATSGVKDMPVEDFVKVLDDIKQNYKPKRLAVCITGGEPLIRKDLEQVGLEIVKRGFVWGIVTNGMLFTKERFISLVKSGMGSMSFSLDGLEKEHTYLRQNGMSFDKTVSAIKTVVAFQNKNPGYFIFDVITCVHKQNLDILPQLRDFLIELGVTQWRIFSIFPSGRASKNDLSVTSEEYIRLMKFIEETRNYKTADGKSIHLNYSCEGYIGNWEGKVRDHYFFCRAGVNVASVMCDGNVTGCLSVRGKDLIQGNIYEKPFTQIWNEEYKSMRDHSWAKKGKCGSCRHWKNCLGNGMHLYSDMNSGPGVCNLDLLKQK